MANQIKDLIDRISQLQDELERSFAEKAEKFSYTMENRKVTFQKEALRRQKEFKQALWRYVFGGQFLTTITAPIIYSLIVPFVFLDIMVTIYQAICFRVYGIPRVSRKDYFVVDRHKLAYLNLLQKLNCVYCGYGNGLLAYVSEIAARTEAYWCPIKHGRSLKNYHRYYGDFSDFGDAENFSDVWAQNRDNVKKKTSPSKD